MPASPEDRVPTNWYVITGGPSCGKTTTVNELRERGYKTTIEESRHYLDLQRSNGKTVEEVESNRRRFQRKVLNMQIDQERRLHPGDIVFLDRAIPDTRACCRFLGIPEDPRLAGVLEKVSYRKVFVLDLLPLVRDYARTENELAQKMIHKLLVKVYQELGFPVVRVPVLSIEDRVDFILAHL
jgi:predicted ATPase